MKITVFNKKKFIEKQWTKDSLNKTPIIFEHKQNFKTTVYDKGNPELFNSYANISGDNKSTDYCRFVKDDKEFCCKYNNSDKEYDVCTDSENIITNYPKSYFFSPKSEQVLKIGCLTSFSGSV